jgi:hypothetical protein
MSKERPTGSITVEGEMGDMCYFSQIYQKYTTSSIKVPKEILLICAPA